MRKHRHFIELVLFTYITNTFSKKAPPVVGAWLLQRQHVKPCKKLGLPITPQGLLELPFLQSCRSPEFSGFHKF